MMMLRAVYNKVQIFYMLSTDPLLLIPDRYVYVTMSSRCLCGQTALEQADDMEHLCTLTGGRLDSALALLPAADEDILRPRLAAVRLRLQETTAALRRADGSDLTRLERRADSLLNRAAEGDLPPAVDALPETPAPSHRAGACRTGGVPASGHARVATRGGGERRARCAAEEETHRAADAALSAPAPARDADGGPGGGGGPAQNAAETGPAGRSGAQGGGGGAGGCGLRAGPAVARRRRCVGECDGAVVD